MRCGVTVVYKPFRVKILKFSGCFYTLQPHAFTQKDRQSCVGCVCRKSKKNRKCPFVGRGCCHFYCLGCNAFIFCDRLLAYVYACCATLTSKTKAIGYWQVRAGPSRKFFLRINEAMNCFNSALIRGYSGGKGLFWVIKLPQA